MQVAERCGHGPILTVAVEFHHELGVCRRAGARHRLDPAQIHAVVGHDIQAPTQTARFILDAQHDHGAVVARRPRGLLT